LAIGNDSQRTSLHNGTLIVSREALTVLPVG